VAGYTFSYGLPCYRWNSVADDHYGHSASTCWNGIGRETRYMFIEILRMLYYQLQKGQEPHYEALAILRDAKVEFVNDLQGA